MTQFLVFSTVLALLTWWLQRRLVRATQLPRPWSQAGTAALVVLWALAVIGVGSGQLFDPSWSRIPAFAGWAWLGIAFYIALGLIVILLALLALRLIRLLQASRGSGAPAYSLLRPIRAATALVVVAAVGLGGYGLLSASRPSVVQVAVPLPTLPAEFDGVRVALISDLHVGPSRGGAFTQRVVDAVNAERPDLILIAGDLVDGTVEMVGPDLEPLAGLSAPLGVFGVSGNHEFYAGDGGDWLDLWDRLGIRTLRNDRVELTRGDAQIDLAGIHDHSAPAPFEPDLAAALSGGAADTFTLLLAHEPRQAEQASDLGVDLQVSGHTHGGQMWPINLLVPLQQPVLEGLGNVGDTAVYTTRGAGAWGPPMRVGASPEITILTLTQGP